MLLINSRPKGASGGGGGGVTQLGLFGDGSDGMRTLAANAFLSNAAFYTNLTIPAGLTLFTQGFMLFCIGTLTVNGTLDCSGNPGGNAVGATGGSNGLFGNGAVIFLADVGPCTGGSAGGAGGTGNGASPAANPAAGVGVFASLLGGAGGTGGASGANAGGGGGSVRATPTPIYPRRLAPHIDWHAPSGSAAQVYAIGLQGGGSGGGGGAGDGTNAGGGGGAGGGSGGIMPVYARALVIGAGGVISANGGAGGNGAAGVAGNAGGGGGGGGGAGGVLYICSTSARPASGLSAAGGAGGAGGAGSGTGAAGVAGAHGAAGIILWYNVSTGLFE